MRLIQGLHAKWVPHEGQIRIGQALFRDGCKEIFGQLGRNWGKTEFLAYALWRWAQSNPGSENYYFTPYMKQSREILWASNRLQGFGPSEWIDGKPNDTEMRLRFKNGSFIKVDGSDNVESYRGVKPRGLSVLDEFKDFRPEFYVAYEPNRGAYQSPILIMGTPPDRECQFIDIAKDFASNPHKKFFKGPSHENPHISREWLENMRKQLIARGEEDVWQREYLAEFVPGGVSKIFPMLAPIHRKDHTEIMRSFGKDMRKLDFVVVADPAAATTFAVLFLIINPNTKHIYCVDEIYETDQAHMSVMEIGKRIQEIKRSINPDAEWLQIYDEAERWFANEMLDHLGESFLPTQKARHAKESGLSIIKDILLSNGMTVSSKCEKLYWEMDNYFKDRNGKIPKMNDHLIDCLRYGLAAMHYNLNPIEDPVIEDADRKRGYRIEDDFPSEFRQFDIGEDYT